MSENTETQHRRKRQFREKIVDSAKINSENNKEVEEEEEEE